MLVRRRRARARCRAPTAPVRAVDPRRPRARVADPRRLRRTTSPRSSRPCAPAAGSSSASIDVLPDEWWPVAVAVATALLDDPEAADARQPWPPALAAPRRRRRAAGMSDPVIGRVGRPCFAAALPALAPAGADADTIAAAEAYYERYVARGRARPTTCHPRSGRAPRRDLIVTTATHRVDVAARRARSPTRARPHGPDARPSSSRSPRWTSSARCRS